MQFSIRSEIVRKKNRANDMHHMGIIIFAFEVIKFDLSWSDLEKCLGDMRGECFVYLSGYSGAQSPQWGTVLSTLSSSNAGLRAVGIFLILRFSISLWTVQNYSYFKRGYRLPNLGKTFLSSLLFYCDHKHNQWEHLGRTHWTVTRR